MQTIDKQTEAAIADRVAALVFERGEQLGREIDSDDEDNISLEVAAEFGVSENLVRFLGELPST